MARALMPSAGGRRPNRIFHPPPPPEGSPRGPLAVAVACFNKMLHESQARRLAHSNGRPRRLP